MVRTQNTLLCTQCPVWKNSLFSDLTTSEIAEIERNKTTEVYERGDVFSRQGQKVEEVYCLHSGGAKVVKALTNQGKESIVRIATPGEMLGYRCIFSEKEYRATAVALDESVACKINKQQLFDLVRDNPAFAMKLLGWFGRDVAAAENHHHSFCLKNTRERVAEALHILASKCGRETVNGILIPLRMMRTDWAEWIGIAKENLIRSFSDFKKDGLISQEDDFIVILDMRRIEAIASMQSSDDIYHLDH